VPESTAIQKAGNATYYLLLRWLAGLDGCTASQLAEHLNTDYRTAWELMRLLVELPFVTHDADAKLYSARLDIPLWKLRTLKPREMSLSCRAALLTYLLTYLSLSADMGITTVQAMGWLGLRRQAVLEMIDHLSAADCLLPIYQDGWHWKIVSAHLVIACKHDRMD